MPTDRPADPLCTVCGRDNRNGTHSALELTGHLRHTFTTATPPPEDAPPSLGKPEREPSAYDPAEPLQRDETVPRHILNPTPAAEHRMNRHVPLVIGLGGLKESGKDTVADAVVAALPNQFLKIGMSDPLHTALMTLNPIVYSGTSLAAGARTVTYREAVERHGYNGMKTMFPEARRLLQTFGTDVARELFDPDVWADKMFERAGDRLEYGYSVLVTGIRFRNELEAIHRLNGITVWIDRPGLVPDGHASESTLTEHDFDLVLINDQSLEHLRQAAVEEMVPGARALHRDAYPDIYALYAMAETYAEHPAEAVRRRPAPPKKADLYVGPIGSLVPAAVLPNVTIGTATSSATAGGTAEVRLDPESNGSMVDKGHPCPSCTAVRYREVRHGIRQCMLCGNTFRPEESAGQPEEKQDSGPVQDSAPVPSERGPGAAGDPAAGPDRGDGPDAPPVPEPALPEPDAPKPRPRRRRIRRGNL